MFGIGPGEYIGLFILAVILVGPERLPKFASDAAKFVQKIRNLSQNATRELRENLGPGYENLNMTDLNPKTFIKKHLADPNLTNLLNDSTKSVKDIKNSAKIDPDLL